MDTVCFSSRLVFVFFPQPCQERFLLANGLVVGPISSQIKYFLRGDLFKFFRAVEKCKALYRQRVRERREELKTQPESEKLDFLGLLLQTQALQQEDKPAEGVSED